MENMPIPLTFPRLSEEELVLMRPVFDKGPGQRMLQLLVAHAPVVVGKTGEERLAQFEQKLGWERCVQHFLDLLSPNPDIKRLI